MVKKTPEIGYGRFQANKSKEDVITNDISEKLWYKMKTKI